MPALEIGQVDDRTPPATVRRRRGPRKGDLKEAAILEAAWRLLAEKPITSISIDELAAGAGISRSSFYFYFPSRDAVIGALARRTSEDLSMAVLAPLSSGRPPREVVQSVVRNLLDRWQTHGPLLRSMDALAERDADLRAFWHSITTDIVAAYAAAIDAERARGTAPPGPPQALDLAWALTNLYWRAGHQMSLGQDPGGGERLVETLAVVTMRAVYGDG